MNIESSIRIKHLYDYIEPLLLSKNFLIVDLYIKDRLSNQISFDYIVNLLTVIHRFKHELKEHSNVLERAHIEGIRLSLSDEVIESTLYGFNK